MANPALGESLFAGGDILLETGKSGKDDSTVVYETPNRIASAQYSDDGHMLFVTQTIDNARQISAIDLKDSNKTYVIYKSATGGDATPKAKKDGAEDEQQPKGKAGFGNRSGIGGGVSLLARSGRSGASIVR